MWESEGSEPGADLQNQGHSSILCLLSRFCCNIKGVGSGEGVCNGSFGWDFTFLGLTGSLLIGLILCLICMHTQPVRAYLNVRKSLQA